MSPQSPDNLSEHPLSEEQRRAACLELQEKLAALISAKPTENYQLREMLRLSDKLEKTRKTRWPHKDKELWERLLQVCCEMEEGILLQEGVSRSRVKKLIRREWARWDSVSERFVIAEKRSAHCNAVEVILIQRDGGFRIHPEIMRHLWEHPLLAGDLSNRGRGNYQTEFDNTLKVIERIESEHNLIDSYCIPQIAEEDGPDRSAAGCSMAALELRIALEAEGSGKGDFCGGDETLEEPEDLAWLREAIKGKRLWQLLNAAVKLGKNLHHYSTFNDSKIEGTIRQMIEAFPGKQPTPQGKAVEQIIRAYISEKEGEPTSAKVLDWLGWKRDKKSDAGPLNIEHQLWGKDLERVTWKEFQRLMKSTKKRMGRT